MSTEQPPMSPDDGPEATPDGFAADMVAKAVAARLREKAASETGDAQKVTEGSSDAYGDDRLELASARVTGAKKTPRLVKRRPGWNDPAYQARPPVVPQVAVRAKNRRRNLRVGFRLSVLALILAVGSAVGYNKLEPATVTTTPIATVVVAQPHTFRQALQAYTLAMESVFAAEQANHAGIQWRCSAVQTQIPGLTRLLVGYQPIGWSQAVGALITFDMGFLNRCASTKLSHAAFGAYLNEHGARVIAVMDALQANPNHVGPRMAVTGHWEPFSPSVLVTNYEPPTLTVTSLQCGGQVTAVVSLDGGQGWVATGDTGTQTVTLAQPYASGTVSIPVTITDIGGRHPRPVILHVDAICTQ